MQFPSDLQAGLWLKSVGLVQRSAAVWRCSACIAWTGWTQAMTLRHDVNTINIVLVLLLGYYYYFFNMCKCVNVHLLLLLL